MKIQTHLGKQLVNVPEFAKRKDVSIPAVWGAIEADRLPVVLVGEKENVFIDWKRQQSFVFDENKKNR